MSHISYGDFKIELAVLPLASQVNLAQRGLAHVLGNEVSSKTVSFIRGKVVEGSERKASDVTTEEVKAYRSENETVVLAFEAEARAALVKEIEEGTLGQGRSTSAKPALSKVDTMARAIALEELKEILTKNGLKLPTGEKTLSFSNGDTFTREELISRRLEKHGERIGKEAKKRVDATAKAVAEELDI